jgi:hypothetical protein
MHTYQKIENEINKIKEINMEAGNILHDQMHRAQNSKWTFDDLSNLLKTENDVADLFFSDDEGRHSDIRNIQDSIINFYSDL